MKQKQTQKTNFLTSDNMEIAQHNTNVIFNEIPYTIEWRDIENVEIDYENYLDDIENFFREDFTEATPEEENL
ncbi:hypothetical protein C1631_017385 [Chryseobacterium phosphatilyticum]|uniref:Uncharacterized protein n=2 Tax=Chryseobacterium phosphatilyticum TaxID=475075 RepID=A0A316X6S3_9FLAO|nr:hypothetical protein C1631_017385 [Chryseobacterium phosphatilyticum]